MSVVKFAIKVIDPHGSSTYVRWQVGPEGLSLVLEEDPSKATLFESRKSAEDLITFTESKIKPGSYATLAILKKDIGIPRGWSHLKSPNSTEREVIVSRDHEGIAFYITVLMSKDPDGFTFIAPYKTDELHLALKFCSNRVATKFRDYASTYIDLPDQLDVETVYYSEDDKGDGWVEIATPTCSCEDPDVFLVQSRESGRYIMISGSYGNKPEYTLDKTEATKFTKKEAEKYLRCVDIYFDMAYTLRVIKFSQD